MYFFLKEHFEKLLLKVYHMSVYMCVMNAIWYGHWNVFVKPNVGNKYVIKILLYLNVHILSSNVDLKFYS